jgi:hypothetical protein
MPESTKPRAIVRKTNPQALPTPDLIRHLDGYAGVRVLNKMPSSLLIEGETTYALERALQGVEGWTVFPSGRRIPVPDTRPRVLKPPSNK